MIWWVKWRTRHLFRRHLFLDSFCSQAQNAAVIFTAIRADVHLFHTLSHHQTLLQRAVELETRSHVLLSLLEHSQHLQTQHHAHVLLDLFTVMGERVCLLTTALTHSVTSLVCCAAIITHVSAGIRAWRLLYTHSNTQQQSLRLMWVPCPPLSERWSLRLY